MQKMMGRLPWPLQAESDGRGREESGCAERGTAGAGELAVFPRAATKSCILQWSSGRGTLLEESSSGPGMESVPVRAVEVSAEGGCA